MLGEKQEFANALSHDLLEYYKNKLAEAFETFQ